MEGNRGGTILVSNVARQAHADRELIKASFERVMNSGTYILGPENQALEAELTDYLGVAGTVLVGNGTDALEIALLALGVGPGKFVITVANAGGYGSTSIRNVGATPIYVDADEHNGQISITSLNQILSGAIDLDMVAAIIVTHLYGIPAPIDEVASAVAKHNIPIIEDCAQALGVDHESRKLGFVGALSTTSFYPTKNLSALGDGGAIMSNDLEALERCRKIRQYGWTSKYVVGMASGRNSRMDELQAAVVRARLSLLDERNLRRSTILNQYARVAAPNLKQIGQGSKTNAPHLAVFFSVEREGWIEAFGRAGIDTSVHYPVPDHLQEPFSSDSNRVSLEMSEKLSNGVFSIPLDWSSTDEELSQICEVLAGR